jgi:hypothetical protein
MDLGPLPAVDRMPVSATAAPGPERWARLESYEDIAWRGTPRQG